VTGRILNLVQKELIQFGRDRLLTFFIVLAPALQLILLARTVEQGIRHQPVAVLDLDHTPRSRQLAAKLDITEELEILFYPGSAQEMRALLDGGQARLAIIIPAGFSRSLSRPDAEEGGSMTRAVQLLVDGTNTIAASIAIAGAVQAVNAFSVDIAEDRGLVVPEFYDFRANVRFNPSMDIRYSTIPAQLGFITYQVTLAVAALGLARERELGTLEQLLVTPLRRLELVIGKGVPALAIGLVNFAAMWAIGRFLFQIPMNGPPFLLGVTTLIFLIAVVSWGLFISAVSRTQQQAILFVFIQAMVDMTLSGYLVAVKNMPPLLQTISRIVPLQYYLGMVRSIMIKGAGIADLWPEVTALVLLAGVMGLVAWRSVARRLD